MKNVKSDRETKTETAGRSKASQRTRFKKTGRILLRALVLALAFCVVIFGGIILSDVLFSNEDEGTTPEIIAITVSGEEITLNDEKTVTFDELKTYLKDAQSRGELYTVALINDTDAPADYQVYNQIVDLLAEYDIVCEKMQESSTADEAYPSTDDEVQNTL